MIVTLDASLQSTLDWNIPKEDPLWIVFDFKLESISLFDPTPLVSFEKALDHFFATHYEEIADRLQGVCLYRGSCHFPTRLEHYEEWLTDHNQIDSEHNKAVHALNILSDYLQRLASRVPDEVEPYAFFDMARETNPWQAAQLVSKERFTHISIATRNSPVWLSYATWDDAGVYFGDDPERGVVLPTDQCFASFPLPKVESPYRMIPEYSLTEMWDGVDTLYYMEEALSSVGKRKLQGFVAAQGALETIPVQ